MKYSHSAVYAFSDFRCIKTFFAAAISACLFELPDAVKIVSFNSTSQLNPLCDSFEMYVGGFNFFDCNSSCNSVFESLNSWSLPNSDSSFVNISIINKTKRNQGLETLFNLDTSLFVTNNFNYSNIQSNLVVKSDLVILNEVDEISNGVVISLQSYVNDGGTLLIIPPDIDRILDFEKYNSLLKKFSINTIRDYKKEKILINKIKIDNSIFKDVFKEKIEKINFPNAIKYYRINDRVLSTSIISFENNFNFLESYTKNKGIIFQFTNLFLYTGKTEEK